MEVNEHSDTIGDLIVTAAVNVGKAIEVLAAMRGIYLIVCFWETLRTGKSAVFISTGGRCVGGDFVLKLV